MLVGIGVVRVKRTESPSWAVVIQVPVELLGSPSRFVYATHFCAGFEIDVLRQLALRGGYMTNLARSDDEGTITAGLGLSPLNLIEIDIAARYTNADAMGASINFLATY